MHLFDIRLDVRTTLRVLFVRRHDLKILQRERILPGVEPLRGKQPRGGIVTGGGVALPHFRA